MRPLIGTSFKMNLTSSETERYLDRLLPLVEPLASIDLFVLPPFTSIWVARERLRRSKVAWGAQDVHAKDSGAHTGDVSAPMLSDLGCTYVEIGHSERRHDHGETDETVALKVAQVLRHRMIPIVCVGEPAQGNTEPAVEFVRDQLRTVLKVVAASERSRVVIAYEPRWAIGLGAAAANPGHIAAVHQGVHEFIVSKPGGGIDARVIYGGSVDAMTAIPILEQEGVDGLFIGRAALDPDDFAAIAAEAQKHAGGAVGR